MVDHGAHGRVELADGDDDAGDFGNDDSAFSDFSGRWRGSASVTANTCDDLDSEKNFLIDLNVEQDDSGALVAFKIQDGAVVMEGTAGTTRLFADVDVQDDDLSACDGPATVNFSIEMKRIEEDLSNVTFEQRINCLNRNATCRVTYFGTIEHL